MKVISSYELPIMLLDLVADILEDEAVPKFEANYDREEVIDSDIYVDNEYLLIKIDPLRKLFIHKIKSTSDCVLENTYDKSTTIDEDMWIKKAISGIGGSVLFSKRVENKTYFYHRYKKLSGTEHRFLKIHIESMEMFINRNISIKGLIEDEFESDIIDVYGKEVEEQTVDEVADKVFHPIVTVDSSSTCDNLVIKEDIIEEELVFTSSKLNMIIKTNDAYYHIDFFIMMSEANKKLPLFYERILIFYRAKVNVNNIDDIVITQVDTNETVSKEFSDRIAKIIREKFFTR